MWQWLKEVHSTHVHEIMTNISHRNIAKHVRKVMEFLLAKHVQEPPYNMLHTFSTFSSSVIKF